MLTELLIKKGHFIENIILSLVLALSLIGIGITDFSPLESHRFWVFMIIFLAFASIGLGWSGEKYHGKFLKELVINQLIHWGATLVTVSGVYLLLNTGRLNYESTGLIIELILGFSLFLDGRNLGWRFSLLGVLIGVAAILAAYVEEYIWIVLPVSLLLSVMTYYWEKYRRQGLHQHETIK